MGDQQSKAGPEEEATMDQPMPDKGEEGNTHRSGNKPVDVPDVEDFAVVASHDAFTAFEFDGNWSVA